MPAVSLEPCSHAAATTSPGIKAAKERRGAWLRSQLGTDFFLPLQSLHFLSRDIWKTGSDQAEGPNHRECVGGGGWLVFRGPYPAQLNNSAGRT